MSGSRGPLSDQPPVELTTPLEGEFTIPDPPKGVLKATRDRWSAFWRSPHARIMTEGALPMLERLFRYYDEWDRIEKEYRAGDRLVEGSQGQLRITPLADRLITLENNILKLEDRLGLNPMAAARLGLTIASQELTWQQVAGTGKGKAKKVESQAIDVAEVLELPE